MELLAENVLQTQQNADNTKSCYRFGARVKLTKLAGEQIVLSGTEGTVIKLSEDGKVYVEWDNGVVLAVVAGIDVFTHMPRYYALDGVQMSSGRDVRVVSGFHEGKRGKIKHYNYIVNQYLVTLEGSDCTSIFSPQEIALIVSTEIKKGDTVMMNSEYLAKDEHKTKIWTVCSEPFVIGRTACVLLDGFSGYYATNRLTVVNKEVSQ